MTTTIRLVILLMLLLAASLPSPLATLGQTGTPTEAVIHFTGDANWPPYHFLNDAGEPDGFFVDLVLALCREQDRSCEIELYQDWAEAQQVVADGAADAVLGFGKTSKREELFDFSETITAIKEVIVVREEVLTVHSLEDLHGTTVAAVGGTPDYQQLTADPRFHVIPVRGEAEGLRKVVDREATAFISDELALRYAMQLGGMEGLKIVGTPLWEMEAVIGVTKGNRELLDTINAGLSLLEEQGTTDEITTKWFGSSIQPREVPSWMRWAAGVGLAIGLLVGLAALVLMTFNQRLSSQVQSRTAALEQEVHERKRVEQSLRESERRFRRLSEAAFEAIAIHDEGVLLGANDQLFEMFGYQRDELQGKQVIPLIVAPEARGAMQRQIAAGSLGPYKSIGLTKDGTEFPMEIRVRAMEYQGRPVRVGAIMDITDRVQAEQALKEYAERLEAMVEGRTAELNQRVAEVEQLNRAMANMLEDLQAAHRLSKHTAQRLQEANADLEAFAYSVSHDLRAPLRAINGFAQIIARRHRADLNEQGQRYFDNIVQASAHMDQLIDDLLRYSRLGRKAISRQAVSLADLLAQLTGNLTGRVDELGAELSLPPADDLPVIQSDPTLLSQILTNLLDNALTYHQPGTAPQVSVSFTIEGDSAIISVADKGIGIAPEFHDKVFQIFQRLHAQDEYPGTGIGLAVVKKAVALLDGRTWVESTAGDGSTFYVELPRISKQEGRST
jgi:PAS domain S-box-containing protein